MLRWSATPTSPPPTHTHLMLISLLPTSNVNVCTSLCCQQVYWQTLHTLSALSSPPPPFCFSILPLCLYCSWQSISPFSSTVRPVQSPGQVNRVWGGREDNGQCIKIESLNRNILIWFLWYGRKVLCFCEAEILWGVLYKKWYLQIFF